MASHKNLPLSGISRHVHTSRFIYLHFEDNEVQINDLFYTLIIY